MEIMEEGAGEILVVRDAFRSCVEVPIGGTTPDEHRVVRLSRHEARRLAALILYQAEKLGDVRLRPAAGYGGGESNCL